MVKALRKGDKKAFQFFFEQYYDPLVAYATTYTHDAVLSEDIVQQAFINFWEGRERLDENRSPRNYLYTLVHNRYIDTVRNNKKERKLLDEIWERALRDRIKEDTETREKRIERMKRVLESLPPKCKKIIQMNKVEGKKYKEIAGQMNISIKTVESQMRIAFIKIREAFEEDNLFLFFLFRKWLRSG